MSKANSALEGMGTTIVAAVINGDLAHIVSVGDSRAYLLGDEIRQITRDHSVVQEMLENGDVTVEEARTHPQKNIITRALGVQKKVDIDYMEEVLLPSEKLLICTDGLTNMVLDSEILALANSAETSSLADKLVALAIEKGGTDNITVVFIEN
jgi:protein phosphatase